jgi:hypothetical protein
MKLKDRTREELEERIHELEDLIARKGIGSRYVQRIERLQRDLNIAVMVGAATTVLGLTAWVLYRAGRE